MDINCKEKRREEKKQERRPPYLDERGFLLNRSRDIINKFGSSIFAHLRVVIVIVVIVVVILRLSVFPEFAGDMIDMNTNREESGNIFWKGLG